MRSLRSVFHQMGMVAVGVGIVLSTAVLPTRTTSAAGSTPFQVLLQEMQPSLECPHPCAYMFHDQSALQAFWTQHYLHSAIPTPDFTRSTVIALGVGESPCHTTTSVARIESTRSGVDVFMHVWWPSAQGLCSSLSYPSEMVEVPGSIAHTTIVQERVIYGCTQELQVLCAVPHLTLHPDVLVGGRCAPRQTQILLGYHVACHPSGELPQVERNLGAGIHPVQNISHLSKLPLSELIVWSVKTPVPQKLVGEEVLYVFGPLPHTLRPVRRWGTQPSFVGLMVTLERDMDPVPSQFSTSVHIGPTPDSLQTTGTWRGPWEYEASFRRSIHSFWIFADCRRTCVDALGHAVQSL